MKTIFAACEPRPEVLTGELRDEIFAARLKDVIDNQADPIYQNPERFFDNTFPTAGLKTLLAEALGRLTGTRPANNPLIRLETAFGGGKTHNLIALYHAAGGRVAPASLGRFVEPGLVPAPGQVDVVGVVGPDLDPSNGLAHPDGVRTFTLWGELAYQLGGRAGYALARESDVNRSAAGTGLFAELIGQRPTLILLDEIAGHMRVAQGVPTATGKSDLAEQTVAFLLVLLEFAASRPHVVVVLTLADTGDAFGKESEHLRQQLAEARRISARQEMVITPTGDAELAAIVTHRLFSRIDQTVAAETAAAYAAAYAAAAGQGASLPLRGLRADYAGDIQAGYPFHPELLQVLSHKTATIPNFQRTRGALRLLAQAVRRLWETQPADAWLIHPHHLDLSQRAIIEDLTSRLERPAFRSVIEADILSGRSGQPAHAQVLDEPWLAARKPPYAHRVATAVFLHSLTQGTASGVDPADLLLAVLQPGDEPVLVARAAERLYDIGWFFEWDGHRYRFKTEPSLNKIITDEMGMVGRTPAKQELDRRIQQVWRSGTFKPVAFPQEAADLDDDAGPPKLAILHYDAAATTATRDEPPELARKLAVYKGSQEAFRTFRNNIVFLVPDAERIEEMVTTVQRYLAIARIVGDAERIREFIEEQRKKLVKMGEAAELDVRVAITKTYRHLFFPRADASQVHANLVHELLPAQDQGEVQRDQSAVVLRALRGQNKVLSGDESPLAAAYVRSKAWDHGQASLTTEELRKAFARRMGLPFLLDLNQLKKIIKNGVDTGVWLYYDAGAGVAYDAASPPPAIQVSDDAYLYLPEEAQRLRLPVRGREGTGGSGGTPTPEPICEVCGNPRSRCTCGDDGSDRPPAPEPLRGAGPPQQAFQQLLDRCHDAGVTVLASLQVTLRGEDRAGAQAVRTLGLALSQLGRGEFRLEQRFNAEYGAGQYISLNLALNDALYKRLKQVTDALAQEAERFTAQTTLTARFESGLAVDGDQFRTIHDVFTTVGLGRIELAAEAAAA